jgi:hypothetical protein
MLVFKKENGCIVNLTIDTRPIVEKIKDCDDIYEHIIYLDEEKIHRFTSGINCTSDRKIYARGFLKAMEEIKNKMHELCIEIEKLPASEQQTKVITMASRII